MTSHESQPGTPEFADQPDERTVLSEEMAFEGAVFSLVTRRIDLGDAGVVTRDVIRHPGAVAVVALDDRGRVCLIRQFRAPVSAWMWEIPAGLLDSGQTLLATAQRELAEEVDLRADRWDVLLDVATTPGGSDEYVRVFLARGLSVVPDAERHLREAEEAEISVRWVPLEEACDAVLAGRIGNPSAVCGVLAAERAQRTGFRDVRDVASPWRLREQPEPA